MDGQNEGDLLIVDDERVIADTLAIILNQHGVPTRTAYDGDLAVKSVQEREPRLVLMNVGMPHSGVEAALQIRNSHPDVQVVMHTGSAGNYESAIQNGLTEFLAKPIHPADLLEVVRKYGFNPVGIAKSTSLPVEMNTAVPPMKRAGMMTRVLRWLRRT